MKMAPHSKMLGLLLLAFLAGSVSGGVITHVASKRAVVAAFDFDRWPDRGMRVLDRRLGLTPEQKDEVRAIQERLAQRMKRQFHESIATGGEAMLEAGREIDTVLTAEQQALHEEMKHELRAAFRRHFGIELSRDPSTSEPGPVP